MSAPQVATFTDDNDPDAGELTVAYRRTRTGWWAAVRGGGVDGPRVDNGEVDNGAISGLVVHAAARDHVDLSVDGVRRTIALHRVGGTVYTDSSLGSTVLTDVERLPVPGTDAPPGSLFAPMPGTVVRVLAEPGQTVTAGAKVLVFEAMKMEHTVTAPADGVVAELLVSVGDTVDGGEVLAVIDTDEKESA